MTWRIYDSKTRMMATCLALAVALVVAFVLGTTSAQTTQTVNPEDIAVATVRFVDDDSGVILLAVDKNRKIEGLERGDEIEVVMQEETDQMKQQRPRRWRMLRHPYGGPSSP